jgi:hypothetical protein
MPETVKIYRNDGTSAELDSVDARRAVLEHPSEWSASPFSDDIVRATKAKSVDPDAQAEAKRTVAANNLRKDAERSAAEEQARVEAEAKRISDEQEAKRKADEEAIANGTSDQVLPIKPIMNDGLKVGHIPSEVPALEAPVGPFEAREKGRGWWAIYDSKGVQVGGGIREPEGKSFNDLSDEDKQEYVNAELAKG